MLAVGKPMVLNKNTNEYEEVLIQTNASEIMCSDGKTLQQKVSNGDFKGDAGRNGTNGTNGKDGKDGSAFVVAADYSINNGYIKYADGTMRCWGETDTLSNITFTNISFPQSFTRVFDLQVMQGTDNSVRWANVYAKLMSNSMFRIFCYEPDGNLASGTSMSCTAKWSAFGMWK